MALSDKQKEAVAIVKDLMLKTGHPVIAVVGVGMLDHLSRASQTPRELLEEMGKEIADSHDHKAAGCTCLERHQFAMDVLDHLEKQKFNDEIIMENLEIGLHAWREFEENFERAPTVTYVESQYTLPTGVAGVFFIHPAAQK